MASPPAKPGVSLFRHPCRPLSPVEGCVVGYGQSKDALIACQKFCTTQNRQSKQNQTPFCITIYTCLLYTSIRRTLFCGQAFRWKELDGRFCGIAGGRYAEISDNGDSTYTVHDIEKSDISYWQSYFDLDTDYDALIKQFSEDEHMKLACKENPGIRVLRQEPFETLISFIISPL